MQINTVQLKKLLIFSSEAKPRVFHLLKLSENRIFRTHLKEDTKTADRVDIYPNPFTNSFIVTFPNPGNTKALFRLTDVSGNVIPMERSFNPGNSGTVTLHPGNLTAGFYFLEMNLNGVLTTKKIMKL